MLSSKELWSSPSSGGNGTRSAVTGTNGYAFVSSNLMQSSTSVGNGLIPSVTPVHDRSQEICKYFVNGGCLRGAACPYLHELPDERHLDVNGVGFILNPNVHNAQKTVPTQSAVGANSTAPVSPNFTGSPLALSFNSQSGINRQYPFNKNGAKTSSSLLPVATNVMPSMFSMKIPSKYRPPEPCLEYNLPPVLALPLQNMTKDVSTTLTCSLLQS